MSNLLKNKKIIIVTGIIILLFFIAKNQNIIERTLNKGVNTEQKESSRGLLRGEPNNVLTKTSILEIDGIRYEGEITTETNVYDFMVMLQKKGKINFTEKNYTGIGKFIVSLNGIKGNGEKNWIYYVNGVKAQVGVSNYKIYPGDIISWKYEKYE